MLEDVSDDDDLRDPTREELHTAPRRELPEEIQLMSSDETACSFCGVSYFVFAEVQRLQETATKYKSTFQSLVRFLQVERRHSLEMKSQVLRNDTQVAKEVKKILEFVSEHSASFQALRSARQRDQEALLELRAKVDSMDKANIRQIHIAIERVQELCREKSRTEFENMQREWEKRQKDAEAAMYDAKKQHDEFKAALLAEKETVQRLESSLRDRDEKIRAMEVTLTEKESLVNCAEREEKELAEEMRKDLARSRIAVDEYMRQIALLREEHSDQLAEERARCKQDLKDLECEHQKHSKFLLLQIEQHEQALASDKAAAERAKSDLTKELIQVQATHTQKLEQLKQDNQREVDAAECSYKSDIERLHRSRADAEILCKQQAEEITQILKQLEVKESRIKTCERQAAIAITENEVLQNHRTKAEEKLHNLERNVRENERLACEKINQFVHDQKNSTAQHNKVQNDLTQQVERLTKSNEMLLYENKRLVRNCSQDIQDQKDINEQLHRQLSELVEVAESQREKQFSSDNQQESPQRQIQIKQLQQLVMEKDREIDVLQNIVHRECLERTILLEQMRAAKLIADPDTEGDHSQPCINVRNSRATVEALSEEADQKDISQSQIATFYEKLRHTGMRKARQKKSR